MSGIMCQQWEKRDLKDSLDAFMGAELSLDPP